MSSKLNLAGLECWGLTDTTRPVVIAGPCSAESAEQMLETARGVARTGATIFRAGIWKPRTRPGCFEGVGSIGLEWLKAVKRETGLMTCTEVASVKHVYEALKAGIDILWVGARTTVNPFAVQAIADALAGVNIPVLVKNPVNPDLSLWMGAIERIHGKGVNRIGAIHRGFSGVEKSRFRNQPQWQLCIELRRSCPNLPMFCDPSHIAGHREFLHEIAQEAMDLQYDGLMFETHCNPAAALSDPDQQVKPRQLAGLLDSLVLRQETADDADFQRELRAHRADIDRIDTEVMALLAERLRHVEVIGRIKKANNVTVLQSGRWDEIVRRTRERGALHGFSQEFTDAVFKAIHQESINWQERILNEK